MDEHMKAAYEARHRQAFRTAYEALAEVWPPRNDLSYWEPTNDRLKEIYNEHRENPLCRALLIGILNYLGDVSCGRVITEDAVKTHKQAFRTALDFIDGVFSGDVERNIENADENVRLAAESFADNALAVELLKRVGTYMDVVKREVQNVTTGND